jgi:DNA-binding NarL/FixJ family response regulator
MTESPAPIGVLVVDDHPLLRDGLAALLGAIPTCACSARPPMARKPSRATSSCSRTWC